MNCVEVLSLRRWLILLSLIVTFIALFQLSQLARHWHYIVTAPAGGLIYATSFDGEMTQWSQDARSTFEYRVQDGRLIMTIAPDPTGAQQHGIADWHAYLRDFDVRVSAYLLDGVFDGSHNNGYGVVFRRFDAQNYYLFIISNDGSYRVVRVLDGETKIMSDWIWLDVIQKPLNAVNHLRVVGRGDVFQFYINDHRLALCIPDNPDGISTFDFDGNCMGTMKDQLVDDAIPFGRIGVGVDLDMGQPIGFRVAFDDVIIYMPEGDAS